MPGYVDGWPHSLGTEKGFTLDDTLLELAERLAAMFGKGDTLPSSPFDGQRFVFQTAAMKTAKIEWYCEYDSTLSGSAKWLVIGGAPLSAASSTNGTGLTGTYASPASGAVVDLPVAGVYEFQNGFTAFSVDTPGDPAVTVYGAFPTGSPDDLAARASVLTNGAYSDGVSSPIRLGFGAGSMEPRYKATGSGSASDVVLETRWMTATPIALGGTS